MRNQIARLCVLLLAVAVLAFGQSPSPSPLPTPTPPPLPVADDAEIVEVLDLNQLETRVHELHKRGFQIGKSNVVVAGNDKVILFLGPSDLNYPDDAEDGGDGR